ncbi:MAG: GTP 3',8-cyclase MoaA [Mesosutterella sp.]|nr:GTP 3',8-cyclase MoaA [Mesosutterella sp.]
MADQKDNSRVIPIVLAPSPAAPIPVSGPVRVSSGHWIDRRGRPLEDIRISLTDHCNFRCRYCKPKEVWNDYKAYLPHEELLSFEEITRIARVAAAHGVTKIRLTGGEPLLRKGVEELIADLARLRTPQGRPLEIAMTTNGSLLRRKARALREAGLSRVTVSLDALDEEIFQSLNDVGFPAAKVLDGIRAALEAGFENTKVNTVVKRGVNESQIIPLLEHFEGSGVSVRFIEYMDTGNSNGWRMNDVVTAAQILSIVRSRYDIEPVAPKNPSETATRWRYGRSGSEFGCICSVSAPFCRSCSRLRVSLDGTAYLCLFAESGVDLRTMMRAGGTDEELAQALGRIWSARDNHYSELRQSGPAQTGKRVEMSYIGG